MTATRALESADDASLGLCRDLLAETRDFDLQLDVDDDGCPAPDFGLESYLRAKPSLSPWTDGYAERVFRMLEACGVADDRWRHLAGAEISKRATLPMPDGPASCIFSLRLISAKVKFAQGRPALAKVYLHGDAYVLEEG